MLSEDHWYGVGWVRLRRATVKEAVDCSEQFLADIRRGRNRDEAVADWFGHVLSKIEMRVRRSPDGMWRFASSLLANNGGFARRADADLAVLQGEKRESDGTRIDAKAALGQLMTHYLNEERDNFAKGGAHEQAVWRRIAQVSNEIARSGPELGPGGRCDNLHLNKVLCILRERFPDDHNLPRTLGTLEVYFGRFCDDCERYSKQEMSWLAHDAGPLPDLEECLAALAQENLALAEAVAAGFDLPLGTITFFSAQAYRKQRGISRRQFDKQVESALPILRRCMELSLRAEMEDSIRALRNLPQAGRKNDNDAS